MLNDDDEEKLPCWIWIVGALIVMDVIAEHPLKEEDAIDIEFAWIDSSVSDVNPWNACSLISTPPVEVILHDVAVE